MLREQEIWTLWNAQGSDEMNQAEAFVFARAIIAAYQAKLLAGGEMPEPASREFQAREGTWHSFLDEYHYLNTKEDGTWPIRDLFTADQLQQYAAACAAQAREKALEEAMLAVNSGVLGHGECAAAIESLKGKQA